MLGFFDWERLAQPLYEAGWTLRMEEFNHGQSVRYVVTTPWGEGQRMSPCSIGAYAGHRQLIQLAEVLYAVRGEISPVTMEE
jgi:hypothetical protein